MSQDVYLRKDCRMCCSKSLVKVMELTPTPPGNNFIKKLPVDEPEVSYPLDLYFCSDCYHLQLTHTVDPTIIYSNYLYVAGTSKTLDQYSDWFAGYVSETLESKTFNVLDIGCNDGYITGLVSKFASSATGIEPHVELSEDKPENVSWVRSTFNEFLASNPGTFDVLLLSLIHI